MPLILGSKGEVARQVLYEREHDFESDVVAPGIRPPRA